MPYTDYAERFREDSNLSVWFSGLGTVSFQGRPLLLYLSVTEHSIGCVLGQHDERGRKERTIYYQSFEQAA